MLWKDLWKGTLLAMFFVALLVVVASLTGCGPSAPTNMPVLDKDGNPTGQVVQQQNGPGVGTGAILGGLAGYMLGRHSATPATPAYHAPPVVHNTVIERRTVIVRPTTPRYTPPAIRSRSTYGSVPSRSSSSFSRRR